MFSERKRSPSDAVLDDFEEDKRHKVLAYFESKEKYELANREKERALNQVIDAYREKERALNQVIETMSQNEKLVQKYHMIEKERTQIFIDASLLYKRGIGVEMHLNILLGNHRKDEEGQRFYCPDAGGDYPLNFNSAMRHWRTCPMHNPAPEILVEYRDGNIFFTSQKQNVEKSLDNLYNTISSGIHFNAGERYPLKIMQFRDDCDNLALISFLKYYYVDFYVVPQELAPSIEQSQGSLTDTSNT